MCVLETETNKKEKSENDNNTKRKHTLTWFGTVMLIRCIYCEIALLPPVVMGWCTLPFLLPPPAAPAPIIVEARAISLLPTDGVGMMMEKMMLMMMEQMMLMMMEQMMMLVKMMMLER
jgi:hypothetical protein